MGSLALFLAGGAIWWLVEKKSHAHLEAEEHGAPHAGEKHREEAIAVEVVHPTPGGVTRTVTQVGSVFAYEAADLFAKVSGYLDKQFVDYGSRVKRGDLLAVISDPELAKEADVAAATVERSKAAVEQAKARIESAKAEAEAAEAAIEQAKADVDSPVATRVYQTKVLARYRSLVAKDAETQAVVDEQEHHVEAAHAAERAARAAVITAQAQFSAAKARIATAKADYTEAVAKVEVDKNILAKDRVLLSYTEIRSPYEGVVTKRSFFPGAFIRSAEEGNSLPLLTVARTDVMRVVTMVPDLKVADLDVGDPAQVSVNALGDRVFEGKVSRFSNVEEPHSRTMYTEIDLPNPDRLLKEGMYGIATITLGLSQHALTIPSACLAGDSQGGKAEVFIIKDGKAVKTPITFSGNDGIKVQVDSGLTAKDEVILNHSAVTNGAAVQARPAAVASARIEP